jgi:chromosome partitioning protein
MEPYVIALSHQKGGVAKTTTASALGATLVEMGYRVLLIDLDPSANLTAGLGFNPAQMPKSMADILLGNETLQMVYRSTSLPGLDIIPSNSDMMTAARLLQVRAQYEELLRQSLNRNGDNLHDFICIDCPPSLGPLTLSAMTAAKLVVIPTQCEYYAIQALSGIFKTINLVRSKYNPNLKYRLLVTMFDLRGNLHSQVLKKMKEHYAGSLFNTKIGFDSKLRASQVEGVPVTVFAPTTRAVQQYRSLAKEIVAYVEK